MNHLRRRAAALALTLALALSLAVPVLAADPMTYTSSTQLGNGLTLTQLNSIFNGVRRQQFTLDYVPGGAVQPLVLYGDEVYGRSSITDVLEYAESQGWHVLAAVNSDFFFTGSGVPTGMTIQDGRLVTSDGSWNAVGFREDGSVILGAPKLSITLTGEDGRSYPVYALNNVRTASGIYLYTRDFDKSTRTTAAGTEVVLEMLGSSQLELGQPLEAYVIDIRRGTDTPIGENQLVISLTDTNTPNYSLEKFRLGERVTVLAATQDPAWHEAVWSTGAGNMLVKNGQLTADASSTSREPRTLLGVRPDGSMSVMECDGRQTSVSAGMTLQEAAQLMIDQGCTEVVNLDGGGSSILAAAYPGYNAEVLSSPSDGKPRECATYLVFAAVGGDQGRTYGSVVYPRSATVLAGGSVPVHAISYNQNFLGFLPDNSRLSATDGYIDDGLFFAPNRAMSCQVSTKDKRCQPATIIVTETIDSLRLVQNGRRVTSLSLDRGETVDLDVQAFDALREVYCDDIQFLFTLQGDIGTIDEYGVLTAGQATASGSVTASWGSYSVTVPVTVSGTPARLLETFETDTSWGVYGSAEAAARRTSDLTQVRYGAGALALSYSGQEGDFAEYLFPQEPELGTATHIGLFARGSGPWSLLFQMDDGFTQTVPLALDEAAAGWQPVTAEIPPNAVALLGLSCEGEGTFALTIDQISAHFGAANLDTQPPQITLDVADGVLTAALSDNNEVPLAQEDVAVRIDGKAASFTLQNGTVTCALPQDGGRHRVTLAARDAAGNLSRTSADLGTLSCSFSDMSDHWAAVQVEFLLQKGVFSKDTRFNPETRVSNEMAATMLSRYLGVDVSQYSDVTLPYTDGAEISEWALPHVKAMYALGVMQGSVDGQGRRVLYPQANCSRAQIMTVLGRTMSRGYQYEPCTFADAGDIPDWARDHMDLLAYLGVVTGSDTGKVNPNGSITRAEFAALLYRMY